jgi:hypothetical protein
MKGQMNLEWSMPKGLRFSNLKDGDRMDIEYNADTELSVYILKQDQADEFRSPSFYKDPLPEPVYTGKNGDITVDIEDDGDYEVLFFNESFSSDHEVKYTVRTHFRKDTRIAMISGSSILFITLLLTIVIVIKRKYNMKIAPEGDRFK